MGKFQVKKLKSGNVLTTNCVYHYGKWVSDGSILIKESLVKRVDAEDRIELGEDQFIRLIDGIDGAVQGTQQPFIYRVGGAEYRIVVTDDDFYLYDRKYMDLFQGFEIYINTKRNGEAHIVDIREDGVSAILMPCTRDKHWAGLPITKEIRQFVSKIGHMCDIPFTNGEI